ncbi:MAG: diacylglycerol kinase family lipid kinase [Bacteroidales bacterium]|nr:diacylglycerol kinase family lipid kinase [Bacteroidales bacterium]
MKETTRPTWAFIVNPVAGSGHALITEQEIKKQVKERNLTAEFVRSEKKGHATELASELAQKGYTYVVAVGGDGTLNEVARSLVGHPTCTLGVIPSGTGNDFANMLGLSPDFSQESWDVFFETHVQNLDVGSCNGNYFFNGMGLGFDAQVASENYLPNGELKNVRGNYLWHILKNLLFFKAQKMQITLNGEPKEKLSFLNAVGIGRRYAGGYYLTPKAIADDGLLDVCMVDPVNVLQRLSILLKVPKGTHLSHSKVHYYQTQKLRIELDHKAAYHLDGELFFSNRFEIEIHPGKIRVIYNPVQDHYFSEIQNS